jgi:hypothetical protein
MNQGRDIRPSRRHPEGSWKHSNVNNARKYPSENITFVGSEEKNKDDASLPKKRICIAILLLGYIVSLSSYIQVIILLTHVSIVNLEIIITGAIGLMFQFVGLIMLHWLRCKASQHEYCSCARRDGLSFFTLSNIKFILSILELLFIILQKSDSFGEFIKRFGFIAILFSILLSASGLLYIFVIFLSIGFLVCSCSASENRCELFDEDEKRLH